jgi:hypothetical protein
VRRNLLGKPFSDSKSQAITQYCFLYSGFSHSRKGIPSEQNCLKELNLLPTNKVIEDLLENRVFQIALVFRKKQSILFTIL